MNCGVSGSMPTRCGPVGLAVGAVPAGHDPGPPEAAHVAEGERAAVVEVRSGRAGSAPRPPAPGGRQCRRPGHAQVHRERVARRRAPSAGTCRAGRPTRSRRPASCVGEDLAGRRAHELGVVHLDARRSSARGCARRAGARIVSTSGSSGTAAPSPAPAREPTGPGDPRRRHHLAARSPAYASRAWMTATGCPVVHPRRPPSRAAPAPPPGRSTGRGGGARPRASAPPRRPRARRCAATVPADGAAHLDALRGAREHALGSVHTAGSPPWASTQRSAAARAAPVSPGRPRAPGRALAPAPPRPPPRPARPPRGPPASRRSGGPGAAQHLGRLAHLQRVADAAAERLVHGAVSDQRTRRPQGSARRAISSAPPAAAVRRGEEAPPTPAFTSSTMRPGAARELRAHDRGGDEARGGHGAGGVAQREEALVARGEARRSGRRRRCRRRAPGARSGRAAGRPRSPGIASSLSSGAARCGPGRGRHRGDAHAERGGERRGDDRGGVAHPARRVRRRRSGRARPSSRRSPEAIRAARERLDIGRRPGPRRHATMHQAAIWASSEVPSSQERTNDSTLSASTGSPLRLRSTPRRGRRARP